MSRVSLACAQCRGRHVRCDGKTPICSRCRELSIPCEYHKSRRGGRPRKPATTTDGIPYHAPATNELHQRQRSNPLEMVTGQLTSSPASSGSPRDSAASSLSAWPLPAVPMTGITPPVDHLNKHEEDYRPGLIHLFYINFYASHPCVLPCRFYHRRYSERPEELQLVDVTMQFIGSLYSPEIASSALEDRVKLALESAPKTGFTVQALTLYATAVYGRNEMERANQLLDWAIDYALELGLHRFEFASTHGGGDAVLAECWRRTWWQLYIIDCHNTAIGHIPVLRTSEKRVQPTAMLPCEEAEYLSGEIPVPKCIYSYDNREFAADEDRGYSSFAHLIGLIRSFDKSLLCQQRITSAQNKTLCMNADCAVKSWLTLLPTAKRMIVGDDGTPDYLIFQAMLCIPVYVIDAHRSLSTLVYHPIESVSSCSPHPPPEHLPALYRRDAPTHTSKIMHSVEAMTEVLLLPSRMTTHSPWLICVVSATTIAHLSACRLVLRDEQLRNGRERIKVAMGAISNMAEIWPRAQTILREVKIIARELLSLGGHPPPANINAYVPSTEMLESFETWDLFDGSAFPDNPLTFSTGILSALSNFGADSRLGASSTSASSA